MKVNGFTTLELTVAMVLAALVTGIGYSGYTLFMKQWHTYNKNLDESACFRNLQTLLFRDFYICRYAKREAEACLISHTNGDVVVYDWSNGYMLRSQGEVTDTFMFPVRAAKMEFNHQEQFIPNGKIDRLEIELEFKKQTCGLVYIKEYSRAELMEWEAEYAN